MLRTARITFVLTLIVLALSVVSAQEEDGFSLQILHSSDNESSFQDPNTLEPKILHYDAVMNSLEEIAPNGNSLYLTAGDHVLPGPFFEAAAQVERFGAVGLADIAFFNAMDLAANGIGNHEFDEGIDVFATMLNAAEYPFLAANLDFSNVELAEGTPEIVIGEDGASVEELAGQVAKSATVEVGGELIGLIGRAPAGFFTVLEDPENTVPGLDFFGGRDDEGNPLVSAVDQVLEQVDLLEGMGVNKIILLDHAQDYTADPLSAEALRGIDIIVAAGSTGFMAQPEADGPFNLLREGDEPGAEYPVTRSDSEGNTVLVVNSDQLYTYVGHLIVTFDSEGLIASVDDRSGPVATTEEAIAELEAVVGHEVSASEEVQEIYNALQETELIQEQFEVIGTTAGELNGQRADVRSVETNLGRLAADSALWFARQQFPDMDIDVALKNGGGIRATILGPNITRFSVNTALAFDNRMAIVDLTATELLAVMENAVSVVPALDGRFPQIAGMTLEYDASREGIQAAESLETPSRVQRLVVQNPDGSEDVVVENFELQGDPSRMFTMVTNSFLLTGGDGYLALQAASEERGAVETEIGERQILVDYIQEELNSEVSLTEPMENSRVVRVDEGETE